MSPIIHHFHVVYPNAEAAHEVAAKLNAQEADDHDFGWHYLVVVDITTGSGKAVIQAWDENLEFVGLM
jgi:hypothetical protein